MTLGDIIEAFLLEKGSNSCCVITKIRTQRGNYFDAPIWVWVDSHKNQFGLRADEEEDVKIWDAANPDSIRELNSFLINKKLRINNHNKYEIDDNE